MSLLYATYLNEARPQKSKKMFVENVGTKKFVDGIDEKYATRPPKKMFSWSMCKTHRWAAVYVFMLCMYACYDGQKCVMQYFHIMKDISTVLSLLGAAHMNNLQY